MLNDLETLEMAQLSSIEKEKGQMIQYIQKKKARAREEEKARRDKTK